MAHRCSDPNLNKTAAACTSGGGEGGGAPSASSAVSGKGKVLPSFNDILWCPDVDGDVMAQGVGGPLVSHTFGAENLDDLSDLVGPELANLMNPPSATAVKVKESINDRRFRKNMQPSRARKLFLSVTKPLNSSVRFSSADRSSSTELRLG